MNEFPIYIICVRRAKREMHPPGLGTNPNTKGFYLMLKMMRTLSLAGGIF